MNYYPDRIADDSDDDALASCCSAVETDDGGALHKTEAVPNDVGGDHGHRYNEHHRWKRKYRAKSDSNNLFEDDNGSVELEMSRHGDPKHSWRLSPTVERSIGSDNSNRNQKDTEKEVNMAHMIQHERDRRLGVVRNNVDYQVEHKSNLEEIKHSSSSNNLLGNIRGWFGGVGGNHNANLLSNQHTRRQSEPATSLVQKNTKHAQRASDGCVDRESDDDSSSSSSDDCSSSDDDDSSSDSENDYAEEDLTPQERARIRALRYLSNSCVDAGRKAKTASYVRGLERLDLKRKRDRLEKELDIVETEMNKDRGRITNVESDCVVANAAKLVLELPCISDSSSDGSWQVLTYDEYMAMLVNNDDPNKDLSTLWDDKEATDTYVSSLQSRLKEALERTRSLEKRLAILEQAGDEIIMSLCEDLVEVTSDSNKAEARYVKKGKELAGKRRREKIRYQQKLKKAERRVRHLEERLLGANDRAVQESSDQSVASSDSSGRIVDDEQENDEVGLEAKLSSIKSKIEENKADHKAEMESVRRHCEQLKLRMSVARLVMEGDENLREYVAILVRAQSELIDRCEDIPTPPQPITRARAKLLKVIHLENIYEQRLSVSKAFSDATINALEQELIERETSGQKMEVRCLNELVAIERETKAFAQDASDRIAKLEAEARELEETVTACIGENMDLAMGALVIVESHSVPATQNDSTSESYSDDEVDYSEPAAKHRRDANLQKSVEDDGNSVREDSRNDTPELESYDATLHMHEENIATSTSNGDTVRDETSSAVSSPPSHNNSGGVKAGKKDALTLKECKGNETTDRESPHGSQNVSREQEDRANEGKPAQFEDTIDTKSISNCQASIDSSSLLNNKNTLELLGHKLEDTLCQYKKSRDSTSAERIKHLTNMNLLVLEIAKAKGVDLESTPNLGTLTSWRRKKSRPGRKQAERKKKSRSEKEKERHRGKEERRRKQKDERNLSLVW